MKTLNKTLIAFAISTSFFASCCKDDAALRPSENLKSDIESVVGNNSRFISYNSVATSATGVQKTTVSIPDAPAIPDGAVNMMDVDGNGTKYAAWSAQNGTNYYLPEGVEWTDQIKFVEGVNYFIEGTLALNFYGTKSEVNILPKGTLKINASQAINNLTVRSWGAVEVDPNTNLIIGVGTSFINYSNCEITANGMQNQGEFVHYGDLTLSGDLDCSGYQSTFTLNGSLKANFMKVSNSSKSTVAGNIVSETGVDVNGNSSLKVGLSMVTPNGKVYSTNFSVIDVADYIKCETLELDSNGKVITHQETLIMCDNLIYKNNTAKIQNADMEGVYTVIVVKNLEEAWDSIDRMNGGGIDLHTPVDEYGYLDWTANVIFNGPTYISEKGLRPEYGIRPVSPERDPVYTLNHVGSVESIDKDNISATSVDFINNLTYFSWHKRGAEYDGYIDVANIGERSILSTLHAETQDFNNAIVVGNKIYAVGSDKKGAILSNINYSNSAVTTECSYVEGGSANSVLSIGENIWVTTNAGITILPENKFIPLVDAKYAAVAGDKVVVLAGVPDASIHIFEQNGDEVSSFSCGEILVENGKNTIFVDNNIVYVALGSKGLVSYDLEGNQLNRFKKTVDTVNGVSVDENFIYMACGYSGLYILDKSDFSLVKSYTLNDASANYVKRADDGLIYVAYGLNGVHILELLVE